MKKVFPFYLILGLMTFVSFIVANGVTNQNTFWTEAAQSGIAEVMLGNMALQKSKNEDVRKLARTIVSDHTKCNEELKTLASRKNATLPVDMTAEQKDELRKLDELSDENFDKEFIRMMVEDHEAAIILFQKQVNASGDSDLKKFAANKLPGLKSHLKTANAINSKMNKNDGNSE